MLTGLQRTKSRVTIRDLATVQELGKAKAVEREVWQLADSDLLPLTMAVATPAAGSTAGEWRVSTRWALKEAIGAEFLVTEFCRWIRGPGHTL